MRIKLPGALLIVMWGVGCARQPGTAAPTAPTASGPIRVTMVSPQRASLNRVIEQPGSVLPFEETHLFARVPGYLKLLHTDIGKRVKGPVFDSSGREIEPGEILAELAVPELDEDCKQNDALILQAEAEVEQSRRLLSAAEANLTLIQANAIEAKAAVSRAQSSVDRWESESRRIAGLVRDGVIDGQTRDETLNQYRAASAAREEANARVGSATAAIRKAEAECDRATADIRAAEAKANVARAMAGRTRAMQNYAKIRAPFDGVVTRRLIHTGDFVQPMGAKNEPLFTIARLDPLRIVIAVPEADAGLVREGVPVQLTLAAGGGTAFQAKITRTSWSLDPSSRTLRAEIDVPNPNERFRPGMYAYSRITGKLPEAWTLPTTAITKQGDVMVCFLVKTGKAVRTPVRVGRNDGSAIEVIQLQSSDGNWQECTGAETVAAKAAGLTDGQAITTDGP